MSTKEQVKSGKLTPSQAIIDLKYADCATVRWCKRRLNKAATFKPASPEEIVSTSTDDEKVKSKYRQKKHQKSKK